jgi:copper resistance protein D
MLSSAVPGGTVAWAGLAWGGHAAMSEETIGATPLGADMLHLLAAGIGIGALAALLLLVFRRGDGMTADHLRLSHRVLDGFGTIGTIVVATLILGLVAWLGTLEPIPT